MATVTKGFNARLANPPFLVFDFRALWRSTWAPECANVENWKWSVSQPGAEFLNSCSYFVNTELKWFNVRMALLENLDAEVPTFLMMMMMLMMFTLRCWQRKAWNGRRRRWRRLKTRETWWRCCCSTTRWSGLAAAEHTRSKITSSSTPSAGTACWDRRPSLFHSSSTMKTPATSTVHIHSLLSLYQWYADVFSRMKGLNLTVLITTVRHNVHRVRKKVPLYFYR